MAAKLAVVLILIASLRIVATYKSLTNTIDEPAHLAAGMEWLQNGTYTYENLHPPLARVLGATGLYLAGARGSHGPEMYAEGWHLLGYGHRYWHNLFYARLAMLPLFWIACASVFLWARHIAGPWEAAAAVLIFTTIPPILGHAGLTTTDMALTAFLGASVVAVLYWLESPTWMRTMLLGLCVGLVILSKFTALLFLPVGLLAIILTPRGKLLNLRKALSFTSLGKFLAALGLIALLILVAYRFSYGHVQWLNVNLPAPDFFQGIWAVWEHSKEGHPAYLLGKRSLHGFWYYYAVVAAVKTPLATMVLAALAALFSFRRSAKPLAFSLAIVLVASTGGVNIGIRHILPFYFGISICAAIAAVDLFRSRGVWGQIAVAVLLSWQLLSGALQHPEYIAYTNELAGGRPDRILADSDLDWGQDMKLLADRMFALKTPEFTFKMFGPGYLAAGNAFPRFVYMPDGDRPRPGWNAVSITPWRVTGEPPWAETAVPRGWIGRSILLFYFPDELHSSSGVRR